MCLGAFWHAGTEMQDEDVFGGRWAYRIDKIQKQGE